MSSVYNTEPPTKGKVVLKTTHGDLDVELWPREAPLACRNFVQLALEGHYDGTPFHRVVPGLAIQAGRLPGGAAATIYGAAFKDEFHSRLRFTHRGLVACAGGANANDAEFFITTAPAPTPHLDRKHTIFGRVAGATIHTVAAVAGVEVDDADVPVGDPPRILTADVLWNPFDDMVPRSTRAEREEAAQAAAQAAAKAAADAAKAAAVKKPQLLSFGGGDDEEDDEEGDGGPFAAVPRRGMVSAHDAAAGGKLAAATDADAVEAVAAARARAVAAAEAKEADAGDAAAFAARMASRVASKRGREDEEEAPAAAAPPPPPPPAAATNGDDRPTTDKRKQASPPPAATATTSATALSAWRARRAAFAGRGGGGAAGGGKAAKKARDADTLDRLTSFTAALRKGKEEKQEDKSKDAAAAAATTTTPALYSGEIRPDADADLPVAWRVAAYLDGGSKEGGGAAADPTLADLATHRLVAPKPTGAGSAATALAAGDGLETIDPLADGRAARGEDGGGRRGGGGERRGREIRGGGHRRR